jgi:hypothetical protein
MRAIGRAIGFRTPGHPPWRYVLPRSILDTFFSVTVGHVGQHAWHHAWYQAHSWEPRIHIAYPNLAEYSLGAGQLGRVLRFEHHTPSPTQVARDVL